MGRSAAAAPRLLALAAGLGLATQGAAKQELPPCPGESRLRVSFGPHGGPPAPAKLAFDNQTPAHVQVFWIKPDGEEVPVSFAPPGEKVEQNTFVGHAFNVRDQLTGQLVKWYRVSQTDASSKTPPVVPVEECSGLAKTRAEKPLDQSRWKEFEGLVQDYALPCLGASRDWSCVRLVSDDEVDRRTPKDYGFIQGESANGKNPYAAGTTIDHVWIGQQKHLVNVTDYEGGFLKMQMTDKMKSLLYPWFEERMKDSLKRHETIPGFFTNSHVVPMDKIELNLYPDVLNGVVGEMHQVLQWWTKQPLQHTTTFGLRVYRRGSMLINHLDRKDTHVASAVIQVGAQADEGWPLEVIHPHKPGVTEVYLQPGEMVLYEGARIVHGRPKRFKGEMFGNIFSHFKPLGWNGPTGWENPFFHQGADQGADQTSNLEL